MKLSRKRILKRCVVNQKKLENPKKLENQKK